MGKTKIPLEIPHIPYVRWVGHWVWPANVLVLDTESDAHRSIVHHVAQRLRRRTPTVIYVEIGHASVLKHALGTIFPAHLLSGGTYSCTAVPRDVL